MIELPKFVDKVFPKRSEELELKTIFKLSFLVYILFCSNVFAQKEKSDTALLIIDIQNFYFTGGKWAIEKPEDASLNAKKILQKFRASGMPVIHVRHESDTEAEINKDVTPINGEKVIIKKEINSFNGTDLLEYLKQHNIKKLVICGMMTHMCVEAAARAAHDFGFECTVVEDACATKTLEFNGEKIPAEMVHYSTLSTLSSVGYAKVVNTKTILENY